MLPPTAVRHCVFTLALIGCAESRALAEPRTPAVGDSAAAVRADDGSTLACRRLTLPGVVNAVAYDSSSGVLVAQYITKMVADLSTGRLARPRWIVETHCLAYDLPRRRVQWDTKQDLLPLSVRSNVLFAWKNRRIVLVDLWNGEAVRTLPEDEWLLGDPIVVVRSGIGIECLDPATGERSWHSPLAIAGRQLSAYCPDSVLYLTGAGLAAVDLSGRLLWEYPMEFARSDVTSSAVRNVITMAIGLAALAPVIPTYWGTHVEMASERPLLRGDRLYATADTEAVCLSRRTGKVCWRRPIGADAHAAAGPARLRQAMATGGREWPGQTLLRDTGDAIAVLGLGFARDGRKVWRTDPPTLTLLEPGTGATLRRVRIGQERALRDYRHVAAGHLVVAPERLFVLDDRLGLRDTVALPAGHLEALGFVEVDSVVLVRTNAGIFELDPGSLEVRWERRLGGGVATTAPRGIGTQMWIIGRHGLLGTWPGGQRPPLWIPFDRGAAAISGGAAITLADRTVEVIPLPSAGR